MKLTGNRDHRGSAKLIGDERVQWQPDTGSASAERTRAVNEVGSAIAHQINEPLTALRLYIGAIRQASESLRDAEKVPDSFRKMVDGAHREAERLCAIMKLMADRFETPLLPDTAAALGRDVINWLSRNSRAVGGGGGDQSDPVGTAAWHSVLALLTPREREVLGHVNEGCTSKQGAIKMKIRPRTFESHRARLMHKLGARNAADLVRMTLSQNTVTS